MFEEARLLDNGLGSRCLYVRLGRRRNLSAHGMWVAREHKEVRDARKALGTLERGLREERKRAVGLWAQIEDEASLFDNR
jgi:hypothetical protein